ncbi:hypothetical protein A7U60_g6360 [Sanghuangporus baumii]|uniref:RRM domain-containing protein n=1 Tax=Sanghuangporus baumii TaxID=108892 RepID=A0A9Q5HVB6_SANBA|nr:hypothetical protein A7U60_g6360 [Sanghuangporus baumii]
MKRSGSQSSSSSHSVTWTERNAFPLYEDLFYRPPMSEATAYAPKILDGLTREDENEGSMRALLDEMRDWYEQSEESESRFCKPLPPPPVEESDDEDAIRKPFGAARALRKVLESNEQFLPIPPTPPLRLKTSIPSTSSTATLEPKTPTSFPAPHRPFADVPQSPISEAFVEAPIPFPHLTSSVRTRSSSLPLGQPPPSLKAVRSEANFHRPPPLKPSSKSLGTVQDHVLLHPSFNKSFSAPSTPTASGFTQAKADKHSHPLSVNHSPYNILCDPFAREGSQLRNATYSRWSLSTAAQDDIPPLTPLSRSHPNTPWKRLPRSPSRLGLGMSFAKFDIMKLVRLPSRIGNRKRLVIKGAEALNESSVQSIRNWCEVFGAVDRISQKHGEVHVHFRNRAMADRVSLFQFYVVALATFFVTFRLTYSSSVSSAFAICISTQRGSHCARVRSTPLTRASAIVGMPHSRECSDTWRWLRLAGLRKLIEAKVILQF